MSPGGIAAIIAAASLLIIAIAIAYAVIKVARLVGEVQGTVRSVNRITTAAEKATLKVNEAIAELVDKNSHLLKLITGFLTTALTKKRSSKGFDESSR